MEKSSWTAGLGEWVSPSRKQEIFAAAFNHLMQEVNGMSAAKKRHAQGWVDVLIEEIDELVSRTKLAKQNQEVVFNSFQ